MPKQIRHACRFLRGNDGIMGRLESVERHTALLRDIRNLLPPPLDAHCLHASLEAGVLTLSTDSPVWASRLRFFAPELERELAPGRPVIDECRIRVRPPSAARAADYETGCKKKLSRKTVRHLEDAAESVGDAALAAALRRLAKAGS